MLKFPQKFSVFCVSLRLWFLSQKASNRWRRLATVYQRSATVFPLQCWQRWTGKGASCSGLRILERLPAKTSRKFRYCVWYSKSGGQLVSSLVLVAGSGETPCEAGIVGAVSSHSPMHRPVISTYISAVLVLAYQTAKKAIDGWIIYISKYLSVKVFLENRRVVWRILKTALLLVFANRSTPA